ncbi:type III secretion system translocon subunit SctB [Terasakiella pusilla]|uniref:type III secretion system translocon subunit SctB n=1 Tax=Terasakiella pusilla TaxID=64973 RepID=UPI003AA95012
MTDVSFNNLSPRVVSDFQNYATSPEAQEKNLNIRIENGVVIIPSNSLDKLPPNLLAAAGVSLPTPGQVTPEALTAAQGAMTKMGQTSPTDMAALFVLMHQLGIEQREAGKEMRLAALEGRMGEIDKQVSDMKEAAMMRFVGAMVSGAVSIGMSVASMASTAKSIKSDMAAGKAQAKFEKLNDAGAGNSAIAKGYKADAASFGASAKQAGNTGQVLQGATQGISQMANAPFELTASGSDTDAKLHEKEAEKLQHSMQEMNEFANSVKDMMADIRSKLAALEQAQADSLRTIMRA